jgi:hypothetical protein
MLPVYALLLGFWLIVVNARFIIWDNPLQKVATFVIIIQVAGTNV